MTRPSDDDSFLGAFFATLGAHLRQFILFISIPAGAGALVGAFAPVSVLFCALVGAVMGFLAWCLWNWQTVFAALFD